MTNKALLVNKVKKLIKQKRANTLSKEPFSSVVSNGVDVKTKLIIRLNDGFKREK